MNPFFLAVCLISCIISQEIKADVVGEKDGILSSFFFVFVFDF